MPTISLTLTTEQATRIADALGRYLNLGRAATLAEAKDFLSGTLRGMVRQYERAVEEAKVVLTDLGTIT